MTDEPLSLTALGGDGKINAIETIGENRNYRITKRTTSYVSKGRVESVETEVRATPKD